mgnify:CR=1 FL=1
MSYDYFFGNTERNRNEHALAHTGKGNLWKVKQVERLVYIIENFRLCSELSNSCWSSNASLNLSYSCLK